jgi:glyoxylase-like metal-dependent hydrolase (beta-lactamase superfamily II)
MPGQAPPLRFNTDFDPETGRLVEVAPGVVRVTAPNAGPFTFTGTNSFLIGDGESVAVLDPGPDDDAHLAALTAAIGGRRVEAILLTHTHRDHCGLVRRLQAVTGGPPLWFEGPHRLSRPLAPGETNVVAGASDASLRPDRRLGDGERFTAAGIGLEAVTTPGHCANHMAFGITGTPFILTGDHVMGWNSTLVPTPDGSMADYLASLEKLIGLGYSRYLPAHGGPIEDGRGHAEALLAHRRERDAQIESAVAEGATSITELVERLYPGIGPRLRPAAAMTISAHVVHLADLGRIQAEREAGGYRLSPVRRA